MISRPANYYHVVTGLRRSPNGNDKFGGRTSRVDQGGANYADQENPFAVNDRSVAHNLTPDEEDTVRLTTDISTIPLGPVLKKGIEMLAGKTMAEKAIETRNKMHNHIDGVHPIHSPDKIPGDNESNHDGNHGNHGDRGIGGGEGFGGSGLQP